MNEPKLFKVDVVLSATTGRLLCDMGEIYLILNHVTGDNLFTHALPRAFKFASPLIKAQHKDLAALEETQDSFATLTHLLKVAKAREAAVKAWLELMRQKFDLANEYSIACHADKWMQLDPIEELTSMVGKERVVVVK